MRRPFKWMFRNPLGGGPCGRHPAEEYFVESGWKHELGGDGRVITSAAECCNATHEFNITHERALSLLAFTCALPVRVARRQRPVLLNLANILNDRLKVGNFEVSTDPREPVEFRYRCTTWLVDGTMPCEATRSLVLFSLATVDKAYPVLVDVIVHGTPPAVAVESAIGMSDEDDAGEN